MSGHSKWSKVKHQKETTDAKKGAAFTKAAAAIIVAVREGGGITDPEKNFRLRLAVEKAREVNMPKENIERAIERGAGLEGRTIESVSYEAYGPGGVALIIDAATDNRQRTVAEVKNILDRGGGTLAGPGAVAYLFRKLGVIIVSKTAALTPDDILAKSIDSGADDVVEKNDLYEIYTSVAKLHEVATALKGQEITVDQTAIAARPLTTVKLDQEKHEKLERLTDELTDLDDVQEVWTNEE